MSQLSWVLGVYPLTFLKGFHSGCFSNKVDKLLFLAREAPPVTGPRKTPQIMSVLLSEAMAIFGIDPAEETLATSLSKLFCLVRDVVVLFGDR